METIRNTVSDVYDTSPKDAVDAVGNKVGDCKDYTGTQAQKAADAYHRGVKSAGEVKDDVKDKALDFKKFTGNAVDDISSTMHNTYDHVNQSRHNAADYLRGRKDEGLEKADKKTAELVDE